MTRLLILLLGLLLSPVVGAAERILDLRDGRVLTPQQLASEIAGRDYILLGELHDNIAHHHARAELLALLQPANPVVVAEHLHYGNAFQSGSDLQADLAQAGFDAQGWEWPLHKPLFQAIADLGLPLIGGNLPPAQAKQVVREGLGVLPAPLAERITRHPLAPQAEQTLDHDLERGHCGHMPPRLLPGMRLAQRARDAAMFDALQNAPSRPAILLAGNGHVRKDYGVPSLIDGGSYVSIGFVEAPVDIAQESSRYDYLWITDPAHRHDPCAQLRQGSAGGGEMMSFDSWKSPACIHESTEYPGKAVGYSTTHGASEIVPN
jgi:uncharacterized iron-regulated protein